MLLVYTPNIKGGLRYFDLKNETKNTTTLIWYRQPLKEHGDTFWGESQ